MQTLYNKEKISFTMQRRSSNKIFHNAEKIIELLYCAVT